MANGGSGKRFVFPKWSNALLPFLILNARDHAREAGPFKPPETITSAWQYRGIAERLVPMAYAAASPDSPHKGRQDLVAHALATVDWLTSECDKSGWWFRKRPPDGDPNVNRFTLGPLLDAVRMLRSLPEGQAVWTRWRDPLDRAVALQRRAYHGQEDWDWGGKAGGEYANQDLYYVLIMALSAELFDRPEDRTEAVVSGHVRAGLAGVTAEQMAAITIAYEPVWAIGTGLTATPEQAEEVHGLIRSLVAGLYDRQIAESLVIQYGGSVKGENASELLSRQNVDGALVGGASLAAEKFMPIIRAAQELTVGG